MFLFFMFLVNSNDVLIFLVVLVCFDDFCMFLMFCACSPLVVVYLIVLWVWPGLECLGSFVFRPFSALWFRVPMVYVL